MATSSSAAQEPCDHPAVVGGLCAVCGADTRKANNESSGEWLSTRRNKSEAVSALPKSIPREPLHVPRKVPRKENIDTRQQQILEKQKNIANSLAEAANLDEEMAAVDMTSIPIPKKQ